MTRKAWAGLQGMPWEVAFLHRGMAPPQVPRTGQPCAYRHSRERRLRPEEPAPRTRMGHALPLTGSRPLTPCPSHYRSLSPASPVSRATWLQAVLHFSISVTFRKQGDTRSAAANAWGSPGPENERPTPRHVPRDPGLSPGSTGHLTPALSVPATRGFLLSPAHARDTPLLWAHVSIAPSTGRLLTLSESTKKDIS